MGRLSHLPVTFHIVLQWKNNISKWFGAQNIFLFIKSKNNVLIWGSESAQHPNIVTALNAGSSPAHSDLLHCNYSYSVGGGGRLGWKRRCNGWKAHQQHLLGGHQKRHLAAGLAVSHQKTLATEPNDSSMGNLEIVQPAYLPLGCDFLHVVH